LAITSTISDTVAFVDIGNGPVVLRSIRVPLGDGAKSIVIPYEPGFRGEVGIVVSLPGIKGEYDDYPVAASRTVVFPSDDELRVDARADRKEYRPGDEARVDFSVRTSDGRYAE